jgi:hypothetical protein
MDDVTLRLAPGTGLVVRRPTALLYSATPDPVLIEAFVAAPDGGELQALASATVGAGFSVGPFVGLSWGGLVRVMAFGDVAVETDQPSLPMLSGAGSRTWVEHTVPVTGGAVVEVRGADTDAATDLVAGTVLAGGFRLELDVDAAPPAALASPSSGTAVDDTASVPLVTRATLPARERPAVETSVDLHDNDMTLPPPASEALLADVRDATLDVRGSLVDAKLCGRGHPNPPTSAACGVCGAFLAPGATTVVHVPRPSLGRLQLDDGELIGLDQELLIGRNPDRESDPARAALRRVKTVGDKVSRSHLEVRFQGWDILVADCGSTNGTFIVPHPGGQVAALEPGRPQMIDPGAVVYFGSRSFTLLGREESP